MFLLHYFAWLQKNFQNMTSDTRQKIRDEEPLVSKLQDANHLKIYISTKNIGDKETEKAKTTSHSWIMLV
jgi:hypothetical protein